MPDWEVVDDSEREKYKGRGTGTRRGKANQELLEAVLTGKTLKIDRPMRKLTWLNKAGRSFGGAVKMRTISPTETLVWFEKDHGDG